MSGETTTTTVKVSGEAAEVARAEALAVLALVSDENRRSRLADLVAAVDDGVLDSEQAEGLGELLELGLATGRIRSTYGPGGEQASLALFRRLPQGRDLSESTRELTEALSGLEGRTLEKVSVTSVGPGEYGISISTDGYEIVLRLGRAGARVSSIGT